MPGRKAGRFTQPGGYVVSSTPANVTGRGRPSAGPASLLPREHGLGLAFEVDVGVAADVDGDALDRAAGEGVRVLPRIVVGHRLAAVPADAQALAGQAEHPGLGLDPALADLLVPVVKGQDAGGNTWRVLAVLVERGRQDQVYSGWDVLGGVDLLLHEADEI